MVESSEAAIKSIELQLVRVETCGKVPTPSPSPVLPPPSSPPPLPPALSHKLASRFQETYV